MLETILSIVIGGFIGFYIVNITIAYNKYKRLSKAYEAFIRDASADLKDLNIQLKGITDNK